jgi:hypothetical protein
MLKRCLAVTVVAAALVASVSISTSPASAAPALECDGTLNLGDAPKTRVIVRAGDSCTVVDSTIKSLRALPGSVDVRVHNTEVTRNLMVRGATGTVHIGPEDCKFDPVVGNNLIVRNSHNVLICFTSVDNNIMVRNNDGRITVRDSSAGNNIMVNRNLAYDPDAGDLNTAMAAKIRLLRNTADNHIVARNNNPTRDIVTRGNSPAVIIA